MVGYIEMHYPASVITQNDQNKHDLEACSWDGKEIPGDASGSQSPAATAGPDSQVPVHAYCERSIAAFQRQLSATST
jgi:hypothetical protein